MKHKAARRSGVFASSKRVQTFHYKDVEVRLVLSLHDFGFTRNQNERKMDAYEPFSLYIFFFHSFSLMLMMCVGVKSTNVNTGCIICIHLCVYRSVSKHVWTVLRFLRPLAVLDQSANCALKRKLTVTGWGVKRVGTRHATHLKEKENKYSYNIVFRTSKESWWRAVIYTTKGKRSLIPLQ